MSDLNTVAGAMGVPADIVRRSAEARATANGITADDILNAWGGGGSVAPTPPPAEPVADSPAVAVAAETVAASSPVVATAPPATPIPAIPAPGNGEPPVLVGVKDNPWVVLAGALALFLAVVAIGLVGPSIQVENPGARTGEIAFSAAASSGQDLYNSLGCAACHTQMIRPIVADVGLGPVTLNDTNQVLGTRRLGPDLAEIGARMSGLQIEATIERSTTHPRHSLSSDDLSNLVAYLLESTTSGTGG